MIQVSNSENFEGINFSTGKKTNLLQDGVIDPAKVTRCALKNAVSVAGTLLLTNHSIVSNQLTTYITEDLGMAENNEHLLEVQSKLDKVCNGIEVMQDKQEEMGEDIAKIKEAVYNPDQGLYARLRELENWKQTSSRMIWTLFTTVIGLIGAVVLKSIDI